MPATIVYIPYTFLNEWVFLSHTPPLPNKSLNIYIGGWAPYYSTVGIFISSIKYINFLPGGGTKVMLPDLLWLTNFDYSCICVTNGLVCAVKVNIRLLWSLFLSSCDIIEVFAVPVDPVINAGIISFMKF